MRILLTAMPFAGHARPVAGVAEALAHRGHEVVACTGARYAGLFERVGCRVVPWRAAVDFDERDLPATFPEAGRRGPLGVLANLEHVFVRTAPGQARDLLAAHAETPFDAVAGDLMAVGTHMFARLAHVPWTTLSILPLTLPSRDLPPGGLALHPARGRLGRMRDAALRPVARALMTPVDAALAEARRELGLGRGDPFDRALYSSRLTLAAGAPLLEHPRADLPDRVRFIGRFEPPAPARGAAPPWMPEIAGSPRPVVLVTQGTLDTDPDDLIRPALAALADLDALVVATIAPEELGGPVPANARCAPFAPFAELLPHVDLAITNGGWGGVLEALAHGVPLVVAGGTLDKPEVAARVGRSGAGLDLRTGRPSSARLRAALERMGIRPGPGGSPDGTGPRGTPFGRAAARVGDQIRALGGASRAAELIEATAAVASGGGLPGGSARAGAAPRSSKSG